MPGESKQTTTQSQQSQTDPWDKAQPLLQQLISRYGGLSTAVTGGQQSALDNLSSSTASLPNFGGAGTEAIGKLFGSDTTPQVGMLSNALTTLQGNLGGIASGAHLNPMDTPGLSDALKTMTSDITNQVKGVYAGSGRDPSGAGSFAGSLGRGLTQGLAPVITGQYNQNVANMANANNALFQGAGSTASGITGQQQVPLANAGSALGLLPQLMQAFTAPGATQLSAANTAYSLPFANLQALLAPGVQLGSLGSQSSGSGTSTTTAPQSTLSNILGGLAGGAGILSSLGGSSGGLGALATLGMLSDERAKDDVEEVGKLHDGQPVYRFKYKGSDMPQIGLLAQSVARKVPDAVKRDGVGLLHVDYGKATARAASMRRAA